MHLFHDSTLNTWRLITEKLPEKPKRLHYAFQFKWDNAISEYNAAVAALKQNALTVGNPELAGWQYQTIYQGKAERKTWTKQMDQCFEEVNPDELYFWSGGVEYKLKPNGKEMVAILTLPEEKKNTTTMENSAHGFTEGAESSGSVAAPKDESDYAGWSHNQLRYHVMTLENQLASLRQKLKEREEETTIGVGDGSGQHFVRGTYDTIKLLQGKLLRLEKAESELAAAKESIKELLKIIEDNGNDIWLNQIDHNTVDHAKASFE